MSDPSAPMKLTVEQAIERLGTGKFQRRMVIAMGLCTASDAMEVLLLSFLSIVVQHEFGVGPHEGSLLTSSVFIGAMIGTFILGRMGDIVGRKPMFLTSSVIISVAGLLTALAQSYWVMVVLRMGVGVGLGGLVIPYDSLAELMPSRDRGRYLLLGGYFWALGSVSVAGLAFLGLQEEGSWRLFVLLCSVPCVISTFLAIVWVPESPRWLASKGKEERALEILRDAARQNGKDPMAVFPAGLTLVENPNEEQLHSLGCLFKKEWRKLTLIIWGVWLGKSFMYWGTVQLVTLVFANEDPNNLQNDQTYTFDYGAIGASALAEVVGATITIVFLERGGRMTLQSILYLMTGIFSIILCLFASDASPNRAVLVVFAFLARMCAQGATGLTWLITAEIIPTRIRNTGHATASAIARIGGACSPWLMSSENSFQTIAIAYGFVTIYITIMVCFLPETGGTELGTAGSFSEEDHTHVSEII
ncbi:Synaptic vesicle 2-related protein [Seminavis robusta]|uniref:Synaptic vesicle 2-related protein n=1 Tax=Seminavis robusta TaxID=568900 RepID=A0A9N8DAS7_9STRA|nr:Synaptic vesicle 2-related protein [Seminavis robusta]|eukprot:Sro18_g013050.1 Synaptic vesicle 2-related protein (475) ;mRNA; r:132795-134685